MRIGELLPEIEDAQDDDEIRVWADGYRIIAVRERGLVVQGAACPGPTSRSWQGSGYPSPVRLNGKIKRDYVASPSAVRAATNFKNVDRYDLVMHVVDHDSSSIWFYPKFGFECHVSPLCTGYSWSAGRANTDPILFRAIPSGWRLCKVCAAKLDKDPDD